MSSATVERATGRRVAFWVTGLVACPPLTLLATFLSLYPLGDLGSGGWVVFAASSFALAFGSGALFRATANERVALGIAVVALGLLEGLGLLILLAASLD